MKGDVVTIETVAITSDDALYVGAVSAAAIDAAGDVELQRGSGVVEVWKNREDGLRQEWRFDSAPPLAGDLVVEVTLTGHDYIATTPSGLHFRGPSGLGIRYSHAIWIDAAGTAWDIIASYEDDRIRMTVPASVIETSVFPAVLDPTVGVEVAIDSPVSGLGLGGNGAAIAFDGSNYLAVWADLRDGAQTDIWATRLTSTGEILDPFGILVASGTGVQKNAVVTFDGAQFVVAWEDFKVLNGTEADIGAATVSTTGAVTALPAVSTAATSDTLPAFGTNGAGALLVWKAGTTTMGARFNNGFGAPFLIGASANPQKDPAVAGSPGGYLVTYTENHAGTSDDLMAQFVAADGSLGSIITISGGAGPQDSSSVAFDGTNYDVVWRSQNPGIDVYGTRVSTAGVVLDTHTEGTVSGVGGKVISNATSNQERPSIACTSAGCLVLWQDRRNVAVTGYDLYGQLLTTGFEPMGAEILVSGVPNYQVLPRVVTVGSAYFAVWQDSRSGSPYPAGARISDTGSVLDANGIIINPAVNSESGPTSARVGTTVAIAWSDTRGADGPDIDATRFSTNNNKLDGTPVAVSTGLNGQGSPAASGTASSFVFAWSDTRSGENDIYAARLGPSGAVVDAAGIAVSTATNQQLVPSVASSSAESLIVWQDRQTGAFDIYGAILTGGSIGAPFVISAAVNDQLRPDVAWNATANQYVVVWLDLRNGTRDIYATRVTSAGAVLDTAGVLVSSGSAHRAAPQIASSGATLLAVWEDRRNNNPDIYGTRLGAGATLADLDASDVAIATQTSAQVTPTLADLGGSWLVAWADSRNAATSLTDIYAQQVSTSGALVDAAFVISANSEDETAPSAIDNSANYVRVSYQKRVTNLRANRMMTRLVYTQQASGTTCTTNSQCSTGFCSDGKCCDSACGSNDKTDCQACVASKTGQPDGVCAPIPSVTICRNYAKVNGVQQTRCDLREYCDGTNLQCPPDRGRNEGLSCNPATGGTGSGGVCPESDPPGPHVCQ